MSFSAYIGTLHESLEDVAWRVHHLPADISIVVWVDDRGNVYASEAHSAPPITADQIVGSYARGPSLEAIEEDLRAALCDRAGRQA